MRQREHGDVGGASDPRGVRRGRVRGLERSLALVFAERRLVHEHLGAGRDLEHGLGRHRVPSEDELAAGPRRSEDLVGHDGATVRELDRLPPLELAAARRRNAERIRGLDVAASRPRALHERVAERAHAMSDRERDEPVVAPVELVAGIELAELVRVREVADPEDARLVGEETAEAAGPVEREQLGPAAERERLQHPRQAEVVVGVKVREEDLAELRQADRRPHELALRSLGAVEEQAVAAVPEEGRRGAPLSGRARPGRPEEDDVQIHAAILDSRRRRGSRAPVSRSPRGPSAPRPRSRH